jgi:hypothetical protein
VWQRVVRAEDPPSDVNRAALAPTELSRLLNGYDICIDDHSYLPTALVERCDRLKHIDFLGTGAGSYMNAGELAQRGIRVHTIKGYGDTAVAEHAIALTIEERDKIAPSRFLSLPPSSVSAAHRFGSDWSRADMAGPTAGSARSRMTLNRRRPTARPLALTQRARTSNVLV